MERKIYFTLSLVASTTAILTSFLISYSSSQYIKENFLYNLPITVGILVPILVLLNLVSYFLTKKLIEPINSLGEKIKTKEKIDIVDYNELKPFIKMIEEQQTEIDRKIYELSRSNKLKDQLTSNISHELKTPLTSINGFAELIASGSLSQDESIKFANIILKECERLLDIINSSLSLSFLEEEKVKFEEFNIKEIIDEIKLPLDVIASDKNVSLEFFTEDISIYANKRMIKDLLYNLLDNAIKYNKDEGYVSLKLRAKEDRILLKIEDSGIGIPKEDLENIFTRFYTVNDSRSKNVSGSGLGLSIVKHIVKVHKGNISIESEFNKGTKITISLPRLEKAI